MQKRKIYYMLHSGKNSHVAYYLKNYLRQCVPAVFYRLRLEGELRKLNNLPDRDQLLKRVNYYCKLTPESPIDHKLWEQSAVSLANQPKLRKKMYYFDAMEIARYFDPNLRWVLKWGDIVDLQPVPSILKSRPLGDNNQNSVLMKLVKVRHFLFVNDKKAWRDKKDVAVFRGDIGSKAAGDDKPNRRVFMNRWLGHPMVDAASTDCVEDHPEWQREKMTIGEHLDYDHWRASRLQVYHVTGRKRCGLKSKVDYVVELHSCDPTTHLRNMVYGGDADSQLSLYRGEGRLLRPTGKAAILHRPS